MREFYPISEPSITQKEIDYVTDAIKSGWVSSLGQYIDAFENKFADFCGTKYALATSNGTTALHLALAAYGITSGDEVIVPDLTFVATANAVKYTGASVVFVDVERETLCLDPSSLEQVITDKTKAIIPVHLYGHPANMTEINKVARNHGLLVIEDAAEAHGSEILGQRVGSLGDCGIFSFYGNKIITSGEGGMITTNDAKFYEKARLLRDHAMSKEKRYWHTAVGFNYRMTNLQAALGLAQLERIDELLHAREQTFKAYERNLSDLPNIRLNRTADWAKSVYWMVCLELLEFSESDRESLMLKLRQHGVDSRPYFYPLSDMPMYDKANTPVAHEVYFKGINLPSYSALTAKEVEYICDTLKLVVKGVRATSDS